MIVSVTVGAVAKKILEILASGEKGRKFIGYVKCQLFDIGIAVFLVLLPMIVLAALFGWMDMENSGVDLRNEILESIKASYTGQYPEHAEALDKIENTFGTYGLADEVALAQMIYVSSSLPDNNISDDFYNRYADCFLNVTGEKSLTDNITEAFGISFSADDTDKINELYGGSYEESNNNYNV